jgi:hypothetical protein
MRQASTDQKIVDWSAALVASRRRTSPGHLELVAIA